MGYNLLINGVYWGYNPLTDLFLTSWDIQVGLGCFVQKKDFAHAREEGKMKRKSRDDPITKNMSMKMHLGDSWMYPCQHTPMGNPYISLYSGYL